MGRTSTHRGIENVLFDIGLPDAEELSAKVILPRKSTTSSVAAPLPKPQRPIFPVSRSRKYPRSALQNRHYKIRGISLERLMQALTALGQNVEIVVTPSKKKSAARIAVAA